MIELQSVVYNLSYSEFVIIAILNKINQIYGFSLGAEKMTEEIVIKTLYDMVKKGILDNDGRSFVVASDYEEMFKCIKYADRYLTIYPQNREKPVCFCYVGENIVITKHNPINTRCIRLEMIQKKDFIRYFMDLEYLPKVEEAPDGENEKIRRAELKRRPALDALIADKNCRLIVVNEKEGESQNDILCLYQNKLEWSIDSFIGKDMYHQEYLSVALKNYLTDMIENKE